MEMKNGTNGDGKEEELKIGKNRKEGRKNVSPIDSEQMLCLK
jgi:hypothetical protein